MKKFSKEFIADGPLLDKIKIRFAPETNFNEYPFSVPLVRNLTEIEFPTNVTFFVGENGTGKSTILETIAHMAGFGAEGRNKNINFKTSQEMTYTEHNTLPTMYTLS